MWCTLEGASRATCLGIAFTLMFRGLLMKCSPNCRGGKGVWSSRSLSVDEAQEGKAKDGAQRAVLALWDWSPITPKAADSSPRRCRLCPRRLEGQRIPAWQRWVLRSCAGRLQRAVLQLLPSRADREPAAHCLSSLSSPFQVNPPPVQWLLANQSWTCAAQRRGQNCLGDRHQDFLPATLHQTLPTPQVSP